MLNKYKLVFDPTNEPDSDSIGAYLRSSDGTLLTHTTSGGIEALDVQIANASIVVTATDLDIRDLDSAQDSVEVLQATHDNLNANANIQVGNADVANGNPVPVSDAGGSLTVDAVNLDIRDLVFATDKVDVSGSTVVVTATNLDIRDLTHVSDSVRLGDGTAFYTSTTVGADVGLDVNIINAADIEVHLNSEYAEDSAHADGAVGIYTLSVRQDTLAASTSASGDYQSYKTDALGRLWMNETSQTLAHSAVAVATTATDLVPTDLANRKRILIQNTSSKKVWIGNSTVTTANGIELSPGSSVELVAGPSVNVYGIVASGAAADVRILELA